MFAIAISLLGITTKSFDKPLFYHNFICGLSNTGKTYGTLMLTLSNANTGAVIIGGKSFMDKYDFEMDDRTWRNITTWAGMPGPADAGKDFLIYGYGHDTAPIK